MPILKAGQAAKYASRRIGFDFPQRGLVFEFYILGKQPGIMLSDIFRTLAKHKVVPLSHTSRALHDGDDDYVLSICLDLNKANCSVDELLLEVRKTPSVLQAERRDLDGRMFDSFLSPITISDKFSAILLPVDALLVAESRLGQENGKDVRNAFFGAGEHFGTSLVNAVKAAISEHQQAGPDSLIENIKGAFRAMGWGAVDFKFEEEIAEAVLLESPSAIDEENGQIGSSAFLSGFLCGIARGLKGKEMMAKESAASKAKGIHKFFLVPVEKARGNSLESDSTDASKLTIRESEVTESSSEKVSSVISPPPPPPPRSNEVAPARRTRKIANTKPSAGSSFLDPTDNAQDIQVENKRHASPRQKQPPSPPNEDAAELTNQSTAVSSPSATVENGIPQDDSKSPLADEPPSREAVLASKQVRKRKISRMHRIGSETESDPESASEVKKAENKKEPPLSPPEEEDPQEGKPSQPPDSNDEEIALEALDELKKGIEESSKDKKEQEEEGEEKEISAEATSEVNVVEEEGSTLEFFGEDE
jgi:hypothetical protein